MNASATRKLAWILLPVALAAGLLSTGQTSLTEAASALLKSGFAGPDALAATVARAGPLILAGLAAAVSFRSGVMNLGVEGQVYLGAMAAAWVGFSHPPFPGWLHAGLATLLAMLVGATAAAAIGWIHERFRIDEVITSIMFNYLAVLFTAYLATYPLKDPDRWSGTTPLVLPTAQYRPLWLGTDLTAGLVLVILAIGVVLWLFYRTRLGFAWGLCGLNRSVTAWAGLPTGALITSSMALSGALAGLGGALLVLGLHHRFWAGLAGSVPWDGILLALLADNRPLLLAGLGLGLAAFLNGMTGAEAVTQIPSSMGQVIVVLFLISALLGRRQTRQALGQEAEAA